MLDTEVMTYITLYNTLALSPSLWDTYIINRMSLVNSHDPAIANMCDGSLTQKVDSGSYMIVRMFQVASCTPLLLVPAIQAFSCTQKRNLDTIYRDERLMGPLFYLRQ